MSAEDRFDGTPTFAMRRTQLSEALQNLWSELEAGYILHHGRYECGQCRTKLANNPSEVKHEEGCVQPLLDAISKASEGEVKEFATAILHGDEIHRAWLIEASDKFVLGQPLPPPRAATPIPSPSQSATATGRTRNKPRERRPKIKRKSSSPPSVKLANKQRIYE